ncbi:MAG: DUF1957 domain-containing protein, partial [Deltaproteobacteria bacterium]|nr:DUF1957 domain-containing protein [Deltaproteobacteria bacterium]
MQGHLSIILHGHLPFVRHPEYDEFLEEDWFFEGVTETYLPLLDAFSRLLNDGVRFRISMVISPTLAAMMNDGLLRERCAKYIAKRIELCEKEVRRTRGDGDFGPLARFYLDLYKRLDYLYNDLYRRDLVGAFRDVYATRSVELLTCAATHGFLPFMQTRRECVRAQVEIGCREFERNFGKRPAGIWLPECAYYHGLEDILAESEIRYFILDTHGILFASPRPVYGIYAPVFTHAGTAVFGRDAESSKQVWSSKEGYPGDVYYRDFYRDAGFDLDFDYVRDYIQPTG